MDLQLQSEKQVYKRMKSIGNNRQTVLTKHTLKTILKGQKSSILTNKVFAVKIYKTLKNCLIT
jgi:ABC-type transport system involved in Fe-S cluster assembly fused permease/ATPase subunit